MKFLPAALAVSTLALAGCVTPPGDASNHWRMSYIPQRLNLYLFNGYDPAMDGTVGQFARSQYWDLQRTFQRQVLNMNRDNPMSYRYDNGDFKNDFEQDLEGH